MSPLLGSSRWRTLPSCQIRLFSRGALIRPSADFEPYVPRPTHTSELYISSIFNTPLASIIIIYCLITPLNNILALFIIRSARTLPETWNPPRLYYGHWVGMDLWCHGLASVPWEWGFPARERQLPFLILSVLPFLIARIKSDVLFGTPVTTM